MGMSASSESPIPSSQRPIPLIARKDITAHPVQYQGEQYWIIKDPLNLEYYRLLPEQYHILKLLDGNRSIEQIRSEFMRQFPTKRPTLAHFHSLIIDLYRQGFVWSTRPGQGDALDRRAGEKRSRKWRAAVRNLLFIRLPGWDPQRLLRFADPIVRWIFHPVALMISALLILSAWGLLALRFDDFQRRLPEAHEFLSWQTLLTAWLILGVVKILHELGHAIACRHFGGECHEIGLAFLIFSPCLYCDVSDSWVLPSKWKRIAVSAAGMYVESVLAAVAILVWWNSNEGFLHQVMLNVFLVSCITTIIFNLNPLLRLDGYYMLSDWLEIPNLRRKSDQLFKQTFSRWCLGIRLPVSPFLPERRQSWFVGFSAASAIYRWFLLFGISYILYQVLKPYHLQNLGLLLGFGMAAFTLVGGIQNGFRLLSAHRDQVRNSSRPIISLAITTLCVLVALLVPLPWHVEAPLFIEPVDIQHVYTSTPGRVLRIYVQPGTFVRRGDILMELANPEKQDRYQKLKTVEEVQHVELRIQQALGDATQETLAMETLRAISEEVQAYSHQLRRLVIVAPCDGTVIAAPTVAAKPPQTLRKSLSQWHGTPLDPSNVHCSLEAGTHVLSIAPGDRFQAVLLIDQLGRHDFSEGCEVKLRIDHLPNLTYRSKIDRIATNTLDLKTSNPAGKDFRGVVHSIGVDQSNAAYQATVLLEPNTPLLMTGMRGHARVLVGRRTPTEWLWRYVRNTFNFHM